MGISSASSGDTPSVKVSPNVYVHTNYFYKQPYFRVEPRVSIKMFKMSLAMNLVSIFEIEAQCC